MPTTVVDVDQRRQGRGQKPDTTVTNPHQHTQRLIILIRDLSKMFSLTNSGELEAPPRLSKPKLTGDDKAIGQRAKDRLAGGGETVNWLPLAPPPSCPCAPLCHCATLITMQLALCNQSPLSQNVSFCFMPDDVENEQNTTEESKHFASPGHRELWINPAANITLSVITSAISGLEPMTPRAGIKCKATNH